MIDELFVGERGLICFRVTEAQPQVASMRVTLPFLTSGSLGSYMVTVLNQTLQLETLAFL